MIAYLQGNLRYKLWYSKYLKWIIRKHIREQIEFRIDFMKPDCYNNGVCLICQCTTTALQMANKACDAPCYPEMMVKRDWNIFKEGHVVFDNKGRWSLRNSKKDGDYIVFYSNDDGRKQLIYPLNKNRHSHVG